MNQPLTPQVLIVGYGPVGQVAANFLGLYGIPTLVIERDTAPYHLPRAIHFDSEIMRIFQALGLSERIATIIRPLDGMQFRTPGGTVLIDLRAEDFEFINGYANANMFYQPELERTLREGVQRFPCVEVMLGHELTAMRTDDDGVTATVRCLETGESRDVRTEFILGCDGARSLVRKLSGIRLNDLKYDRSWLVVDGFLTEPVDLPEVTHQICDPKRPVTLLPSVGLHRRWEFMMMPGDTREELETLETAHRLLAPWLKPHQIDIQRHIVYAFHSVVAERFRDGRVMILGDAAHQMPPFLGQGMCAGIRDAANLCWKLERVLRGVSTDALLDTFSVERAQHVRDVTRLVIRFGRVIQSTNGITAMIRNLTFRIVSLIPLFKKRIEAPEPPRLMNGLVHRTVPPTGRTFIQARVSTSAGPVLMDDLIGHRFAIVALNHDPVAALSPENLRFLKEIDTRFLKVVGADTPFEPVGVGLQVVQDSSGQITRWFQQHRVRTVLMRPDRYVFSFADVGDTGAMVEALAAAMPLTGG